MVGWWQETVSRTSFVRIRDAVLGTNKLCSKLDNKMKSDLTNPLIISVEQLICLFSIIKNQSVKLSKYLTIYLTFLIKYY